MHHLKFTTHYAVSAVKYSNENLSKGRMSQHPESSLCKKCSKYDWKTSSVAKSVITIFCIVRHVTSCPLHFFRNYSFQPVSIPQLTYTIATETSPYLKSGIPSDK